jgi:hypothetical protein
VTVWVRVGDCPKGPHLEFPQSPGWGSWGLRWSWGAVVSEIHTEGPLVSFTLGACQDGHLISQSLNPGKWGGLVGAVQVLESRAIPDTRKVETNIIQTTKVRLADSSFVRSALLELSPLRGTCSTVWNIIWFGNILPLVCLYFKQQGKKRKWGCIQCKSVARWSSDWYWKSRVVSVEQTFTARHPFPINPLIFFFVCVWYWSLNSGPTPWATLPATFYDGFFWDRILQTICPGWLWTSLLLTSASWVDRMTDMSHQCSENHWSFVAIQGSRYS